MQTEHILGVDVGASGIKGAIVDIKTGDLRSERLRFSTPQPSSPAEVAKVFAALAEQLNWTGAIGCGFPSIIKNGVACTAANIDKSWIGTDAAALFSEATGDEVFVINDADAAGLAEMRFGEGIGKMGTVLMITIGSGLGTGLFVDGKIVPNTEFGHLFLKGHHKIVELYASNNAKEREELSWEAWANRFDEYLHHLDRLLSPDLFILGGGSSKYFELYKQYFTVSTPTVPARLLNSAGMVGAAVYAWEKLKTLQN